MAGTVNETARASLLARSVLQASALVNLPPS
jgi:hypothetical protein